MAIGSQAAKAANLTTGIPNLVHDVFINGVVDNVKRESALAMLFQDAQQGTHYRLEGDNMKFGVELDFVGGAMASPNGKLPAHVDLDIAEGSIVPIQRFRRIARDRFVSARASGPGSYEDYADRLLRLLWSSWKLMEIRHATGSSTGYVCKVSSRTSSTVFVAKDGWAHAGTNPLMALSKGHIIAWYDVSAAGIGGAGKISSVNRFTNAVTMDSASTWEPSATIAANDYILIATTNDSTADYFDTEKDGAPNGFGIIVDPDAVNTTVFGVAETTYPNWKPFRQASATFDQFEVTSHMRELASQRGIPITNDDVAICQGAVADQLARTLAGFQQQVNQLGGELNGGWTDVVISGVRTRTDPFFYHDVWSLLHTPALYRINLGGDAALYDGDGSEWSRIADFNGEEAFVSEYMQYFSDHRGAHSALTGISTPDVTSGANLYSASWSY